MDALRQNSARKNAPMRLPTMWLFAKMMFSQRWMCMVSPSALSLQPVTRTSRAATTSNAPLPGPLPWGPMGLGFTDPDGFVFTVVSEA